MEGALSQLLVNQFRRSLGVDGDRVDDNHFDSVVDLQLVGEIGVRASVHDSSGRRYEVTLNLDLLFADRLGTYCQCYQFLQKKACQHVWSAICQLETEYHVDIPNQNALSTYQCARELDSVGRLLRRREHSNSRSASAVASGNGSWQTKLMSACQGFELDDVPAKPPHSGVIPESRFWFAICLSDLASENRFQIHLFQSHPTKGGGWSVPTSISISKMGVSTIRDVDQRRIFSLLNWSRSSPYPQYGNYPRGDNENCSSFGLTAEVLREALSALGQAKRLVRVMATSSRLTDYQTIEPDVTDQPWRFALDIRLAEESKMIDVVPVVKRSEEAAPDQIRNVDKVVGVCSSGALLFEDTISDMESADTIWVRGWQRTGSLQLPYDQLNTFLTTIFGMERTPELLIDGQLGVSQNVGQPRGRLKLSQPSQLDTELRAEVFFDYGDEECSADDQRDAIWSEQDSVICLRDRAAESKLLDDIKQFSFREERFRLDTCKLRIHRKWLSDLVSNLTEQGWEVVSDGKMYRSANAFDIKVSSGEDWFDLNAEVDFDGQVVTLPTLLQALRRDEKHIVLGDGTHGILPEKWLKQFAPATEMGQVEGDGIRFQRNQALMLDMLLAEHENVTCDRSFSSWCQRIKSFSGVKAAKQPRGFKGQLRGYQLEGLGWLRFLNEFGFGGCLADDMGLGKTVQVLALLQARRIRRLKADEVRKPSIVIVPKSLVFNWLEEASKFAPKLQTVDYTGSDRSQRLDEIQSCNLVVTTYATFRLDVQKLKDTQFDYAILDESQAIKNPKAQASKAVRLLRADHRLTMTGTPVENHLGDLWSQFEFLNPGMLGRSAATSFSFSEGTDNQRLQTLSSALRPFILRRTKGQVLKELPEKTEQTLYCDMSSKQKKLYSELRDHYRASLKSKVKQVGIKRSKIHVLEALLRLRQVACDPRLVDPKQKTVGAKVELLVDQLEDVVSGGHKALVFSQFTSYLSLVKKEIDKKNWTYEYLDGKSSRRAQRVKRFQEDVECSLFLISLKAGGHGLNLTAAEYVYILDPWWNPAVEAQAIDRAHRMGQQNPVMAYRMITRGTVEEKIIELQKSKKQLADAIISDNQSLLRSLSMEDLQILFE